MSVTTLTPRKQSMEALKRANTTRLDVARLRGNITHGDAAALRGIYLDPPACAKNLLLYEPLKWAPGIQHVKLMEFGRAAVADGVNPLVTFSRASERSRLWVLANIHIHRNGRVSLNRVKIPVDEPIAPALLEPPAELPVGGYIPNARLRESVLDVMALRNLSWASIARDCGWFWKGVGDGSRVRRALGVAKRTDRRPQVFVRVATALTIAGALHLSDEEAGLS